MKKAAKGQRRWGFRNKYLALISLMLLFFGFAHGQAPITYTPMIASGYQFKYLKADSGLAIPFRNLSTGRGTARPGPLVLNTVDSLVYYWNGATWTLLNGGGNLQKVTDIGNTTTNPVISYNSVLVTGADTSNNFQSVSSPTKGVVSLNIATTKNPALSWTLPWLTGTTDLLADNAEGKQIQLPNANGFLAHSVNGIAADVNGNIIDTAHRTDTAFIITLIHDSLNLIGPDTTHLIFPLYAVNDSTEALKVDSLNELQYGTPNYDTTTWHTHTLVDKQYLEDRVGGLSSGGTVTSVTGTAPITITSTPTTTPNVTISQATTSTNGYLSSTDWNVFNNKVDSVTKNPTADSFYIWKNGTYIAKKDSIGGNMISPIATALSPNYYGTIYERTAFADTVGWSTNGASGTISGNKIALTGGTAFGDYSHSIDYNYYTCLDNFVIESKIIVGTVNSTSYGIGIGVRSSNTLFSNTVAAVLDLTNTVTAGKISFSGERFSTAPTLSSTGISFVAGDTIYLRLERRGAILTFFVKNYNNYANAPVEISYSLPSLTASGSQPPNTGKFAIFSLGGTHSAYYFKAFSNDNLNIDYAILGDSKSLPIGANTYTSGWVGQVNPYINVINLSGTGDRIAHVLNRKPEILALRPKTAIIAIGRNDVAGASGTVTQALKDSLNALNTYLHAAGTKTLFLRPFYESNTSMAAFDTWMVSNFPDSNLIDTYTPTLKLGGAGLLADSVHQNQLGQNQVFAAIRASGKIQGLYQNKNATLQNSGVNTYIPFYNGNNQLGFSSSFSYDSLASLQLLTVGNFKAFRANSTYVNLSLNGSTAAADANFLSGSSDFNLYINRRSGSTIIFRENNAAPDQMRLVTGGKLGIGVTTATSWLHLKAGSKVAGTAPLGFTIFSLDVTAASGNGTTATLTFAAQSAAPFAVGDTIVVAGSITPSGYLGTYAVTASSTTTVSYLNSTTGSISAGSATITQGQKLTTPVAGKMEWDGNSFYGTDNASSRSTFAMWAYVAKSSTYTATYSDYTIDCTSGTFTVTLPTAVGVPGRVFIVKNSGAGTITMAGTLSQTFDGAASPTIAAGAVSQWQSTGANWIKIN